MTPRSSNNRIHTRQTVDLVTEIKRIVRSYPGGLGIIKELIQNADDAGASQVHITLDLCTHEGVQVPEPGMQRFLGPSLLVSNDSIFNDKDFEAIEKIGRGSKKEDLTKAGRFGLGFNSVYHVTDYPSIASRDRLIIFDPLGSVFEDQGMGWRLLESEHEASDFLKVYEIGLGQGKQIANSTVVRLPLRTQQASPKQFISKTLFKATAIEKLKQDLLDLTDEVLLFLKSVTSIRISEIESDSNKENLILEVKTTNKQVVDKSRRSLITLIKQQTQKGWLRPNFENTAPVSYLHELQTESLAGTYKSKWRVCQMIRLDAGGEVYRGIQEMTEYEEKTVPWAGVAARLETTAPNVTKPEKLEGKTYCFLPLNFPTGLPVHVHGFFDLDEARTDLTRFVNNSDDPSRKARATWNLLVVKHVLAPVYAELLTQLVDDIGYQNPARLYCYFPTSCKNAVLEQLANYVLQQVYSRPVVRSVYQETWVSPQSLKLLDSEWKQLRSVLQAEGVHFPDPALPPALVSAFKGAGQPISRFTPSDLRSLLHNPTSLGCELEDAPRPCLRKASWILLLLQYCTSDGSYDLRGLPLAILENGTLETFGYAQAGVVFWVPSTVRSLLVKQIFGNYPHWFLNEDLTHEMAPNIDQCEGLPKFHPASVVTNLKVPLHFNKDSADPYPWDPSGAKTPNQTWLAAVYRYLATIPTGSLPDNLEEFPLVPGNSGHLYKGGGVDAPLWPTPDVPTALLQALKYFKIPLIEAVGELKAAIQAFLHQHSNAFIFHLTVPDLIESLLYLEQLPTYRAKEYKALVSYLASDRQWQLRDDNIYKPELRALAIYPTLNNQPTALDAEKVYVPGSYTPPAIAGSLKLLALGPTAGSQEWHDFYTDFLGVQVLDHFAMIQHLLETYSNLNSTQQLEALAWIRDHLDLAQSEQPSSATSLRNTLRTSHLVLCEDGQLRSVSSLYHPQQKKTVQKVLGNQAHFPDMTTYSQGDWLSFFQKLGIQQSPSAKDILAYVDTQIEQAQHGVSKAVYENLKGIFEHIREQWEVLSKEKVSGLNTLPASLKERAWLPVERDQTWLQKYYPGAMSPANRLHRASEVSFTGSYGSIAASQKPLFHAGKLPLKEIQDALGFKEPTRIEVVQHFKVLIRLWEEDTAELDSDAFVKSVKNIYSYFHREFLSRKAQAQDQIWLRTQLQNYKTLWNYCEFYKPEHTFQREYPCFGSRRQKIAPDSPIREVFELLGQKPYPEIEDYIDFLDEVAEDSRGEALEGEDLECAIAVLQKLSTIFKEEEESPSDYDFLLLSDDNLLLPPETLYIPDAPWYLEAITDRTKIKVLHSKIPTQMAVEAGCCSLLENVTEKPIEITPESQLEWKKWSSHYQSLVRSTAFLGGLARLIAHQQGQDPEWDETWLKDWLTQVKLKAASEITTALYMGRDRIASGIQGTHYYCPETTTLYVASEEDWILHHLAEGLNQEIQGLAKAKVNEAFSFDDTGPLLAILGTSDRKIEICLDRLRIKKLNRVAVQFPDEGEPETDEIFDNDLDTEDDLETPTLDSSDTSTTQPSTSTSNSVKPTQGRTTTSPSAPAQPLEPQKAKPILPQDRPARPIIKPARPTPDQPVDSNPAKDEQQTQKTRSLEDQTIRRQIDSATSSTRSSDSTSKTRSQSSNTSASSTTRTTYPQQYRHGVRVLPDREKNPDFTDLDGDAPEPEKQSIDQAGTLAVMEFERTAGREPKDMNEEQPNHPGYDIESQDPKTGEVRYIEVKSLKRNWDRRGVCVTRTQFVVGDERRSNFWLYVVECATSEPKIHRIQNPVGLVGEFYYDGSWQQLGEEGK